MSVDTLTDAIMRKTPTEVKVVNTVTTTSVGGFSLSVAGGVFWYVWGVYGFWWGLLYGFFWPVWVGYRMAWYFLGMQP